MFEFKKKLKRKGLDAEDRITNVYVLKCVEWMRNSQEAAADCVRWTIEERQMAIENKIERRRAWFKFLLNFVLPFPGSLHILSSIRKLN